MFKEVTKLGYLDSTIPDVSAPVTEVLFILTENPSPPHRRWWRAVIPPP